MDIYLVRHALSERNAGIKSEPNADLTGLGIAQAKQIGEFFEEKEIDSVYCSELNRVSETLKEILPHISGDAKIIHTSAMNEHDMGVFGNKGKDDWASYEGVAREEGKEIHDFTPEGGESLKDTWERAENFYKLLIEKHSEDEKILLVGNGLFLLYLILSALGKEVHETRYFKLNNARISHLEIGENGEILKFDLDRCDHLV
jgi:broad specificity phosphatase PhoE